MLMKLKRKIKQIQNNSDYPLSFSFLIARLPKYVNGCRHKDLRRKESKESLLHLLKRMLRGERKEIKTGKYCFRLWFKRISEETKATY